MNADKNISIKELIAHKNNQEEANRGDQEVAVVTSGSNIQAIGAVQG